MCLPCINPLVVWSNEYKARTLVLAEGMVQEPNNLDVERIRPIVYGECAIDVSSFECHTVLSQCIGHL